MRSLALVRALKLKKKPIFIPALRIDDNRGGNSNLNIVFF